MYKNGAIEDPSLKIRTKIKITSPISAGGSQYLVFFFKILNFVNILIFFNIMFYLNSHRKKNFATLVISFLVFILFFYLLFFVKTYFTYHEKAPYLFDDLENLRFHKKYSKIVHHLRDSGW